MSMFLLLNIPERMSGEYDPQKFFYHKRTFDQKNSFFNSE